MAPELGSGLIAIRAGYGAVLLLAPHGVLSKLARQPCDRTTVRVARVLGVRELVQAALLRLRPQPRWQLCGAGVDALHGASMLGLALVDPDRRVLALANARTAGLLALSCVVQAGVSSEGWAGTAGWGRCRGANVPLDRAPDPSGRLRRGGRRTSQRSSRAI